eukprot:2490300-Pyramimonas_sp.AAC.1
MDTWAHLGAILDHLGGLQGPSSGRPASFWSRLGSLWSALEAIIEASGVPHGSILRVRSDLVA